MKHRIHRLLALALCAVMALGCFSSSVPAAGAAQLQQGAEIQQDQLIYAKAGEATFVPAGYTYVYEAENGSTYTKTVPSDAYVTFEALSPKEAEALATLDMGDEAYLTSPEGDTMVSRSFDAKEAAALSNAVKEILGEQTIEEGQQLQVVSPAYTAETEVRVMITFEDNAVIRQPKMNVALGETLGAAETQAARTLEQKQNVALASMERKLGHSIEVGSQFTLLTNAAAVTVPYGELAEIRKMEGVKSAYVMPTFEVPEINAQEVTTLEPNMKYVAPGMGATSAWDYGFDGAGMSVAIIDSGLYYSNPANLPWHLPRPTSRRSWPTMSSMRRRWPRGSPQITPITAARFPSALATATPPLTLAATTPVLPTAPMLPVLLPVICPRKQRKHSRWIPWAWRLRPSSW